MVRRNARQVHTQLVLAQIKKVNDWVQTVHILTKLRCIFTGKTNLQTNSCHKECTPSARKLHVSNVKAFKQQLRIYGCNLFAEVNTRDITTGDKLLGIGNPDGTRR